ncbi:MAG: hypothetical protein H6Q69_829 [Firmicutes bacterium]|nr:hypothetical protein [Bacillota bacterium]
MPRHCYCFLVALIFFLLTIGISLTLYTDLLGPTEFKVLVVGHVMAPGLYAVTPDTRIYQLLIKAGSVDDTVDLTAINLATRVRSRLVWVPGK